MTALTRGNGGPGFDLLTRYGAPVRPGAVRALFSLAWAAVAALAVVVGPWGMAILFAAVGSIAALQTARAWRAAGMRPSRVVAGSAPVVLAILALLGLGWAGLGVLFVVVVAIVVAVVDPGPGGVLATGGNTVRCALGPMAVAVAMVQLAEISWPAVAVLLVLAAGYDLGCHVWSSDGSGHVVGWLAGIITVLVLTLAVSAVHTVFELEPFGPLASVWVFGGLAATLCPIGPLVASALLPAADAPAPALRRIDALVVAAPVWLFAMWGYLT
jgi:hypothetical protein